MNRGKPFTIGKGTYFSGAFFYLGVSMILPGILLGMAGYPLAVIPFFLISMVTLTTHNALEIDIHGKCYREYVWVLGLRLGEWTRFDAIEYIFIKANKESQTIHSRISSRDLTYDVYDGFVRFSEKEKIHLATARNKEALLKKITPIARDLEVDILDYTEVKAGT